MTGGQRERRATVAVFALALGLYAATTHRRVFVAGNDAARWATIESIVERGTTSIADSRFGGTVDQVRLDGRVYANKPPLLAFAGAAIYAPLRALTGWSFAGRGAANLLHVLVVVLVGVPAALLVAAFYVALGRFADLGAPRRVSLTVALAVGTLVWPYATTLNSHVPAAFLLFSSFLLALDRKGGRAGMACGIAAGLDVLPALGLAPAFAALVAGRAGRPALFRFVAGTGGGAALALFGANAVHHGSALPLKMVAGAADVSARSGASFWGVVLPESPTYPVEILFGAHGLFAVSPVLLFGLLGLVLAARRPVAAGGCSPSDWRWLGAALALQILAHALLAGSYGGWAYGFRYLLPIQPLLLFAAPLALAVRSRPRAALFAVALGFSTLFAALGAYHPWPPAYEQEATKHPVAALVSNPIGGNASAWLFEHAEGSALERRATRAFVSADRERARAYYTLFFGSKGDFAMLARLRP